jgi:hypothetical protein
VRPSVAYRWYDEILAVRLPRVIAQHPIFGYRRLWSLLHPMVL